LHAFRGRLRAEIVPAPATDLAKSLAAPPAAAAVARSAPARAEAWLSVPDAWARRTLAQALGYAGMKWPPAVVRDEFAALHADKEGGLLVYAEPAGGPTPSWSLVVEGPEAALPDLSAFGLPAVSPGAKAPLPAAAAPLTTPFGPAPTEGEIAMRDRAPGERVVALGVDADVSAARRATEKPSPLAAGVGSGREIARFGLSFTAAQRLLGPALSKNGLLSSLAGGDLEGSLTAEGTHLVLDLRRVPLPGN
jgi:hypothetical protein